MSTQNICELAEKTRAAMEQMGLSPYTAWHEYGHVYLSIVRLHTANEKENFDRELVTNQVCVLEERFERGELSLGHYQTMLRGIRRITEMHDTGRIEWSAPNRSSRFVLNEYYENILSGAILAEAISVKAKNDMLWVGRKYFFWLIQEGHCNLKRVGAEEIQKFMIYCSKHMVIGGVRNVQIYMRKLYGFLKANGYSEESYIDLLSFKITRESKVFPAIPKDEIEKILDIIDRRTQQGKRDYAIVLLGVATGLRACDIMRLRLSDIDWRRGEIKLVQIKTGKSLALPLTKDVGEAIRDYILHGRAESESDALFLRVRPPFTGFANAVTIGDMYDIYRKKAGLPRDAHDGKGFHGLRRSLGKNMVTSGVPVTTVAQVLGHESIDSTKKYISLDSEHLKECALDFTGIRPERGEWL